MLKTTTRYGMLLALTALICTALSVGVYLLTVDKISESVARQQQQLLAEVIPSTYFDNNLLARPLQPNEHGLSQIQHIYVAEKNHQVTAYAYETTAPDGYSGDIRLLVGLTPQGEVLGVRVIEHKETPGLGDKIERRVSDWILSFTHQFIRTENLSQWAVKKDGGKFDQFAGATITPRAVVNQVKRSALTLLDNQAALPQASCGQEPCHAN